MLGNIFNWLGRLSVGRKLMLIYLLDLTAVIYVSGILIHEKFLSIDFTRKEIVGAAYTEVVRHSLMSALLSRPAATSASSPAPVPAPAASPAIMPPLSLPAVRALHDGTLGTAELAGRFAQSLARMQPQTQPQAQANQAVDVPLRGQLLADARQLLTAVGNQSNLILDPDLDSYYVMSLSVLRFPELLQMLHDAQVFMQKAPGGSSAHQRTAELLTLVGRLEAVLLAMEADYTQAWAAGGPALQQALAASRHALLAQARGVEGPPPWMPLARHRPGSGQRARPLTTRPPISRP